MPFQSNEDKPPLHDTMAPDASASPAVRLGTVGGVKAHIFLITWSLLHVI